MKTWREINRAGRPQPENKFNDSMAALIILVFFAILLCVFGDAHAADRWDKQDVELEVTWEVLHAVDWGTTLDITRRYDEGYYESNPILGRHPSAGTVNVYMGAWALLHPVITHYLPGKYRPYWQLITIGVSGGAAASNINLGLNVKF